eukprot:scaffold278905_cov21-Prasinocladus_malaysianus.AAC.1
MSGSVLLSIRCQRYSETVNKIGNNSKVSTAHQPQDGGGQCCAKIACFFRAAYRTSRRTY